MKLNLYKNGTEYGATTEDKFEGQLCGTIEVTEKQLTEILENWNLARAFNLLNG